MPEKKTVQFKGNKYIWDGTYWYDSKTFAHPPDLITKELNDRLANDVESEDTLTSLLSIIDNRPHELVQRASILRDKGQLLRAEKQIRLVLDFRPGNSAALAVLCSILRARGKPQQALNETDQWKRESYPELLTSRAAALCDLKRWDEAKYEVGRALAIKPSQEAFNVANRIKAKRPDLYS